MGERTCAFEGCNALEFRTSGYCLRHKGNPSDEKDPHITSEARENSRKPVKEDRRIPIIGLLYFPFIIILFWLADLINDQLHNTPWPILSILAYTAGIMLLLSVFILPIYGFYILRIIRQRIENGTSNIAVTMFYLISFIIPLIGVIGFWFLASVFGSGA